MVFGRGRFWNCPAGLGLLVAVADDAEDGIEVLAGDVAADIGGFVVDLDNFAAVVDIAVGLDIAVAAFAGPVVEEEAVDSYSVVAREV